MEAALHQRVRERAYEIWMADGMSDGSAERHWFSAELAVRGEAEQACDLTIKPSKSRQPAMGSQPTKAVRAKKTADVAKVAKPAAIKAAAPRKAAKAAAMEANV